MKLRIFSIVVLCVESYAPRPLADSPVWSPRLRFVNPLFEPVADQEETSAFKKKPLFELPPPLVVPDKRKTIDPPQPDPEPEPVSVPELPAQSGPDPEEPEDDPFVPFLPPKRHMRGGVQTLETQELAAQGNKRWTALLLIDALLFSLTLAALLRRSST